MAVRQRLVPRRTQPKPIRWVRRELVSPSGDRVNVRVPVYGPPAVEAVRLPELGLDPVALERRRAARTRR